VNLGNRSIGKIGGVKVDTSILTVRLLLATLFGVAALSKLADHAGWQQALRSFGVPAVLVSPVGTLLPMAELVVAGALLSAATAWWGALGAFGLVLLFAAGIGFNLARGRKPDCHCFGQLRPGPVGLSSLVRNGALAGCAGFVVWQGASDPSPSAIAWWGNLTTMQLMGLVAGVVVLGVLAIGGWLGLRLLRRSGRLQGRLEVLEARLAANGAAARVTQRTASHPLVGLAVGTLAPSFRLMSLQDKAFTLDALRALGKPVLLIFSDPGCGACRRLLPDVARWQRDHAADLTIALISRGTSETNRARFAEHGLTHVLLQQDREVAQAYRVRGTPSALLVQANGAIGSPLAGGTEEIRALVRQLIAPLSASERRRVMAQRFVDLHEAYLSLDGAKYTSLLRATLRHARRLEPAQCVAFQRQLIDVGNLVGYDGLESVWLVYQDCAAAGQAKSLRAFRIKNVKLLKDGLRFIQGPAPQLPLRVTHWNSTIERGVRGEALRVLLEQFVLADPPTAQGWSVHQLLNQPATRNALCDLPTRSDQFGRIALSELIRQVGCLTGAGPTPTNICDKVFPRDSSATSTAEPSAAELGHGIEPSAGMDLEGISDEDKSRLRDFCDSLTGVGEASAAGIDDLDAFSEDQCASEGGTRLYETEKIHGLIQECYFSDEGNPLAIGATSADIGRILNIPFEYKIGDDTYGVALMVGKSHDDPGRSFYGAYGSTPKEAMRALLNQLADDPPNGWTVEVQPDGLTEMEGEYDIQNPDGTKTHVEETIRFDETGSVRLQKLINEDGSITYRQENKSIWGDSSTSEREDDANGKTTKKTETETDEDGKKTTKTTEYHYDDEGKLTGTTTTTVTDPDVPSEMGQFDPHNQACQQLMALEVLPGSNRGKYWNELFNRPYKSDPRTIDPSPEDEDWSQEPFCGAPTLGSNDPPTKCRTPVMCAPDTYMDESCKCQHPTGGVIVLRGCATVLCPEGSHPVPVGANACICQTAEADESGPRPTPGPSPDVPRVFSELIWNRPDGRLFITADMANPPERALETRPR
jgi:peroxiredoxin